MDLGKKTAPQECGAYLIIASNMYSARKDHASTPPPSLSIPVHNPGYAAYG